MASTRSRQQPSNRAREAAKRVRLIMRIEDAWARRCRVLVELLEQLIGQRGDRARAGKQRTKKRSLTVRRALLRRRPSRAKARA